VKAGLGYYSICEVMQTRSQMAPSMGASDVSRSLLVDSGGMEEFDPRSALCGLGFRSGLRQNVFAPMEEVIGDAERAE
jgi:hypothetical protein